MDNIARQATTETHNLKVKIPPYAFFLAPAILIMLVFSVYPIISIFQISFTDMRFVVDEPNFVHFTNFEWALNNRLFIDSVENTVRFTVFSLVGHTIIGLFFAMLLNQPTLTGLSVYRTVVLFAWIMPELVMAAIMAVIFGSNVGVINHWLELLGLNRVAWLNDPAVALNTLIIISIWRGLPFNILMYLTALQVIDDELYEAGSVDGANVWQSFRHITLPMIMPTMISVLILGTINVANAFFTPFVVTGGGPLNATTLWSISIYDTVFENQRIARGAAMSVIVFGILFTVSMVYYFLLRRATERVAS